MVMAGSDTSDAAPVTRLDPPPPFVARPVVVAHVVVPLDGSPFAERALPVGAWIAAGVGGDVHLVQVVPCDAGEEAEGAIRYLDAIGRSHAAVWDVVESNDVGSALADAVGRSPGHLACLATHGRGRSLLLGSVAVSLLEHSARPVILVGPMARVVIAIDAPIVVAVDGTAGDEVLVPVALGWADRLGRQLDVVTVAEPAPSGYLGGARMQTHQGPAEPDRYLESLVARANGTGVPVVPRVIYDPVSVRDDLVSFLNRTAALVVLGSHHRPGLGQMVLGSNAIHIVHGAAVPALVVPLPPKTPRHAPQPNS
jgi:nucleotide-binding universal stress UspA family protein